MPFALIFSKAFYTLSPSILVPRLGHYGLDGWATRWVKAWLDGQARRVMVTGQTLPGCVGLVGIIGLSWNLSCLIAISATWMR